jgi:hypothetical protein
VNGQPGDGYDAQIYNKIFEEEFPDTRFVSVGSCMNMRGDNFAIAQALLRTVNGTKLLRLRDRDEMTSGEVSEFLGEGIRVLSVRNLEGYMFDDEVLELLCEQQKQPDKVDTLKAKKREAVDKSVSDGNRADDFKKVAQSIHHSCKTVLESVRRHSVQLHNFLIIIRIDARYRNARALRLRHSQSLASLRHLPSHANVRSTTHRLARTSNP